MNNEITYTASRIFKPAGTLLFGKAMLPQFRHELNLLNVKNPAMITTDLYRKKAVKAAAAIAEGKAGLQLSTSVPDNCDCLILSGGKALVDRYYDDPRPKAWIILSDDDLFDYTEPLTDFIVADSRFFRNKAAVNAFMKNFAFSISDGLASHPGECSVPSAFAYSCRTRVIAGSEALSELPRLLSDPGRRGMKKPIILTDKGIVASGIYAKLAEALEGFSYETFDDIPPDSSSEVVNKISRIYSEKGCDGIIALGGGSVLDTGKGVFLNVSLGKDDLAALAGANRIPELDTAFIAVPTTSGTGSEVTKVAVVSDAVRNRKILYVSPKLMPDYGILDSRLTVSLPPYLTSITGVDALSHAVEAYTCIGKNPLSDQMAWRAIELIRDNLIPAITDPQNLTLRQNLALASMMAGQAFSNSMVGMVHTIGHSIGAVCHAPHGACMSVLLPAALEYNFSMIEPLLAGLLPAFAGDENAENIPYEDRAQESISCIKRLNSSLKELTGGKHPTVLSEIRNRNGDPLVHRTDFQLIAETSLGDASIVYNPAELRITDILKVLEDCY